MESNPRSARHRRLLANSTNTRSPVVWDARDWPVVAVALLLNIPVWTEDQDFFGSAVPTHSAKEKKSAAGARGRIVRNISASTADLAAAQVRLQFASPEPEAIWKETVRAHK